MTDLAVAALVRKRAVLAGRIEHARSELDAMLASLAALDATLRLFDPGIRVQAIRPKPFPPVQGAPAPAFAARLNYFRSIGAPPVVDVTPPAISGVAVSPSAIGAVVTWQTNESATSA